MPYQSAGLTPSPIRKVTARIPHPAQPPTNVIKLRNLVILSERSESKNLPIYELLIRNDRAKILRLALLAQDDTLNLVALSHPPHTKL